MKRLTGIIICILFAVSMLAANYTPVDFHSTSVYTASPTNSRGINMPTNTTYGVRPTGSMSTISASNFQTLNSEGGACYQPSAISNPSMRKISKPGSGEGGTGIVNQEYPLGDTPWLLFIMLVAAFMAYKHKNFKKLSDEYRKNYL